MKELIEGALDTFKDAGLARKARETLRDPEAKRLLWEYGENEPYDSWLIADLGERDVWVAYCEFGHGALGYPWGLVFKNQDHFGMDAGWYPTMEDLYKDWIFEC